MVFPVVVYGYKSWTIKKVECQRIDAFELWCWIRLLRVPWTARKFRWSVLEKISSAYSLEGLMLKPKLQFFGQLMRRIDLLEKTLMLGKIQGGRRRVNRGWASWMASLTRWTWDWVNSGSWWWTGRPGVLQSMGSQRVRHDWAPELNWIFCGFILSQLLHLSSPSGWLLAVLVMLNSASTLSSRTTYHQTIKSPKLEIY